MVCCPKLENRLGAAYGSAKLWRVITTLKLPPALHAKAPAFLSTELSAGNASPSTFSKPGLLLPPESTFMAGGTAAHRLQTRSVWSRDPAPPGIVQDWRTAACAHRISMAAAHALPDRPSGSLHIFLFSFCTDHSGPDYKSETSSRNSHRDHARTLGHYHHRMFSTGKLVASLGCPISTRGT